MYRYFTFDLITPTTAAFNGSYLQDTIPDVHVNCHVLVNEEDYITGWYNFDYNPVSKVMSLKPPPVPEVLL